MPSRPRIKFKIASAVGPRQTLRALALCWGWFLLLLLALPLSLSGQVYDSLDAYPPRWHLAESDCGAQVQSRSHVTGGGVDGRGCETFTFTAGNGTEAVLVYPIEPVRPLDDLTANVYLLSARPGARIGFRVRYPYLQDAETRRPISVHVYGAGYDRSGEFASVGVGMVERQVAMKTIALRREHGIDVDLSDPYVDAVVINAYSGQGTTTLRIDELRIDGMLAVGGGQGEPAANVNNDDRQRVTVGTGSDRIMAGTLRRTLFPAGRITRVLQYNNEPLPWLRSLAFDAVLLAEPPDEAILREAIQARMTIIAPPPSAPDPDIESLLDPVIGWYVGTGVALDRTQVEANGELVERIRKWPQRWQRPIVGAPVEAYREYALQLDAVTDDAPPRVRSLTGSEEVFEFRAARSRLGPTVQRAIGITTTPPESLLRQSDAIAVGIGAPQLSGIRWHSMWVQTMRALETAPDAILYRSSQPLASGMPIDSQRAMALSYINRMIAMIEPWIAEAAESPPPPVSGAPYRCGRLTSGSTDLLVLTSSLARGDEVLAGDGKALQLSLAPTEAAKTYWRLTHFSAERLMPELDDAGARVQIVSPDAVELILISEDPTVGGRAANLGRTYARQAGLDRWQLTAELIAHTRQAWNFVAASGLPVNESSIDLVSVAERTLQDAEPYYRAGDLQASMRMARRADAWALRSRWRLAETLMPDWPHPTSCPPLDCGGEEIQTTWFALMSDSGWGPNRLSTGGLDTASLLHDGSWQFGKRLGDRAESEVVFTRRGALSGPGALRARVTPLTEDGLAGGYEGTVIQIRSPGVRVSAGSAIRIDAMVRTLGFGQPHQGVLIYDSVGGQQAGVLVRGQPNWQPVRLYRQALRDEDIQVMFELIGPGEATIDDVQLSVWEPESQRRPQTMPLSLDGEIDFVPISSRDTANAPVSR